jgi:voltage-gated potassium channel Kch
VWNLSNISQARLVAFTFPATPAVVTAMHLIRERNPAIAILVRAAFTSDALRLADAGADIVVQDEQETARATVNRTLAILHLEQGKKDPDAKSEQK